MSTTNPPATYGWIFDGPDTHPPYETPPCPVCGSEDTWTELVEDPLTSIKLPSYRHCRSCAGPKP